MSAVDRLDRLQRRRPGAGLPIAVVYKFVDDQGSYLAALMAYYGFLSLFPLLLLFVTILGYALNGDAHLQHQILNSALSQFPVIGDQIGKDVKSLNGSALALAVGILGSIYGGLGVAQAAQNAMNKMWAVPRNVRPNPLMARARSLLLLVIVGGGIVATTAMSAVTTQAQSYGVGTAAIKILSVLLAVVLDSLLFLLAFRVLTARVVSWRDLRTGAIAVAIAYQLLQWVGTSYVKHQQGATATYGLFSLVLGLLAWIYLLSVTVVICTEFNVVRARRLWPRSLLTPFTDNVQLTGADKRAYASYAQTERHKGFETVDVDFGAPRRQTPPAPTSGTPGAGSGSRSLDEQVPRD